MCALHYDRGFNKRISYRLGTVPQRSPSLVELRAQGTIFSRPSENVAIRKLLQIIAVFFTINVNVVSWLAVDEKVHHV